MFVFRIVCYSVLPDLPVMYSYIIIKKSVTLSLWTRGFNGPVIIASSVGGTDIENVAERTPHLIKTVPVDVSDGVTDSVAESVADFLKFEGSLKIKVFIYNVQ